MVHKEEVISGGVINGKGFSETIDDCRIPNSTRRGAFYAH